MNPSLSVVIPVYNVEKYLSMCIDSLLAAEGIDDVEIILVDDGSTDKSGVMADDYSDRFQNIRVIHKANEGPSESRNVGISEATGKYIFFCDSDDEVVPSLFSKIISITRDCDYEMILWDSDLLFEREKRFTRKDRGYYSHFGLDKKERVCSGKQILEELLKNSGEFITTVWLGAYKRSYLIENSMYFEKGLIHEDELWVPQVMIQADCVLYVPEKIYLYRIHNGSITNPVSDDNKRHAAAFMKVYPYLYEYYDRVLDGDPLKALIKENLTKRYLHMIFRYHFLKYGYGKMINKKILWDNSRKIKHKVLVIALFVMAR